MFPLSRQSFCRTLRQPTLAPPSSIALRATRLLTLFAKLAGFHQRQMVKSALAMFGLRGSVWFARGQDESMLSQTLSSSESSPGLKHVKWRLLSGTHPVRVWGAKMKRTLFVEMSEGLIAIINSLMPYEITGPVRQEGVSMDSWGAAGPAMLCSAAGTMHSANVLRAGNSGASQDIGVLVRRIYEYSVDYAWVAIDPTKERLQRWAGHQDFRWRPKHMDRLAQYGVVVNEDAKRRFDIWRKRHGGLPGLDVRAQEVDSHWADAITGAHAGSGMEKLYSTIYSRTSPWAHPTPNALADFIRKQPAKTMSWEVRAPAQGEDSGYNQGVIAFAAMVQVASHCLPELDPDDLNKLLEGWASAKS